MFFRTIILCSILLSSDCSHAMKRSASSETLGQQPHSKLMFGDPVFWDFPSTVPVSTLYNAQNFELHSLKADSDAATLNKKAAEGYLMYSEGPQKMALREGSQYFSYIEDKLRAASAYLRGGFEDKAREVLVGTTTLSNFVPQEYPLLYSHLLYKLGDDVSLNTFANQLPLTEGNLIGSLLVKCMLEDINRVVEEQEETLSGYLQRIGETILGPPAIECLLFQALCGRLFDDEVVTIEALEHIQTLFLKDPFLQDWTDHPEMFSPFITFPWCEFNFLELARGVVNPDDPRLVPPTFHESMEEE